MKENHKVDELLGNIAKLKSVIDEKDEIIVGLVKSKEEDADMIRGLKESKEEDADMIRGLEESKVKDDDMIRQLEKTIDEIYNSTTWRLASKFTGGQTKWKKN